MMKLSLPKTLVFWLILMSLSIPFGHAQATSEVKKQFDKVLEGGSLTGTSTADTAPGIETVVGSAINAIIGLSSVGIVVLIIYAGFLWAGARGNDQQIATAKRILIGAFVGLLIMAVSAVTVNLVISTLGDAI